MDFYPKYKKLYRIGLIAICLAMAMNIWSGNWLGIAPCISALQCMLVSRWIMERKRKEESPKKPRVTKYIVKL